MKTLEELKAIRDKIQAQVAMRDDTEKDIRIVVGMATCGISAGARPVLNKIAEEVTKRNIQHVMVTQTGCIGICQYEPVVEVFDKNGEKTTYVKVDAEKAVRIINDHVVNGQVVQEYTIGSVKA